jgi:hypothetical protein
MGGSDGTDGTDGSVRQDSATTKAVSYTYPSHCFADRALLAWIYD